MELRHTIEIIFIVLLILSGIAIFVFVMRAKDNGYDYDKIIKYLDEQKETNLKTLEDKNKEIDKIESQILECKKELKMKLFDK